MNEPVDPYRAPASELRDESAAYLETATRGRRFLGYLVDGIALWLLNTAALIGVMVAAGSLDPNTIGIGKQLAVSLGAMLVYYILMEGLFARTLGKFVCGMRVVTREGGVPTWSQVVGRTFARWIPFEFLAIFGEERLMLHDSLAKTRVVRASPAPERLAA
jgi:uncharacterized RDD family membrane protein YckC